MKKLASLFLSLALCAALLAAPQADARGADRPDPTPTPAVTLQPIDPDGPGRGEPPAEPQDDSQKPKPPRYVESK